MNKVLKHLFTDALFTVISSSVAILTLALLCVCVCACLCCETVCMQWTFPYGILCIITAWFFFNDHS